MSDKKRGRPRNPHKTTNNHSITVQDDLWMWVKATQLNASGFINALIAEAKKKADDGMVEVESEH